MPFKLSRKTTMLLGLLAFFIILTGIVSFIEIHNNISPTPTSSPTPTNYPSNQSNTQLVTNYSITIPEIYKVNEHVGLGFGVAEINLKFIAPSSNLQSEQRF